MIFKKRTLIFIYILFAALWAQPDSLPNVSSSDSVSVDVLQAKPDTSAVDSPLVASSIEDSAPSIPSIAVTDSAPLIPVFLLPSEVEHFCATKAIVDSLPVHLEAQFLADRFPSSGDTSGSMVIQVSAKRKEKEKTCEFLLTANALIPPDTFSTEMRKSFDPKDSISWGKLIQGAPQELARRFLLATRGNLSISCSEEGSVVKMDGVEDSFPCPTQFTNLRRGNYRVTVTNPSGWDPKVDSIGVRPQQTAQLQIQLQRSQAWLDSV
ncbi:MAG TPA: PEGA domain-containing protein, partial [Fibrobacteraceae bacterium]|nr:PEGA domain-containing protein [Fibrobacteraceae bacterium]